MEKNCIVLVADDNRDAADSLALLIESLGYRARAVYDGREAVETCAALRPEVAILDVQMPELDGCAAARRIRQSAHPPALIASLTALGLEDEPLRSGCGAFDMHLAKPARLEQIRDVLSRTLGAPGADGR